jgi:hypothetical protein
VKLQAFRELRDRLYDGSLVLPRKDALLDELARVQIKLDQGGAKILLPRSSKGHCDMAQALALGVLACRFAPRPLSHRIGAPPGLTVRMLEQF